MFQPHNMIGVIARDENGVAATEFSLIIPVLFVMIVALVDFGLYINQSMKLQNTARAAAEYIYQGGDPEQIEADIFAHNFTPAALDETTVTRQFICECAEGEIVHCTTNCGADDYLRQFVEITLQRPHQTIFPYPWIAGRLSHESFVRLQVPQ